MNEGADIKPANKKHRYSTGSIRSCDVSFTINASTKRITDSLLIATSSMETSIVSISGPLEILEIYRWPSAAKGWSVRGGIGTLAMSPTIPEITNVSVSGRIDIFTLIQSADCPQLWIEMRNKTVHQTQMSFSGFERVGRCRISASGQPVSSVEVLVASSPSLFPNGRRRPTWCNRFHRQSSPRPTIRAILWIFCELHFGHLIVMTIPVFLCDTGESITTKSGKTEVKKWQNMSQSECRQVSVSYDEIHIDLPDRVRLKDPNKPLIT